MGKPTWFYICIRMFLYWYLYYGMIFQYVPKNWMIFHMFNCIIWRIQSTSPLQQGLVFSSSARSGKSMNIHFFVRRNLKILETPCPSLRGDVRRMQGMARHGTAERWIAYLAWRGLNRINRDVQIFRMVGDFVRQRRQPLMNYIYIYMQYYIILYARSWFML